MHGLWQVHTRRGARTARRRAFLTWSRAHGMADPWALRHKRWKKRVYLALVEAKNLRRASCLHALSRPEIVHFAKHRSLDADLFCPQRRRSRPFRRLARTLGARSRTPRDQGEICPALLRTRST